MSKISLNATQEELQLLADRISQNNLTEKIVRLQNSADAPTPFANGDEIILQPGFAEVRNMISTTKEGKREITPFLALEGTLRHSNKSEEKCYISVRQLVTPTIALENPGESLTRNQLVKRFGNVPVTFLDTRDSSGKVVTLPCLDKEVHLQIVTAKVWVPKFDEYNAETRSWTPIERENYGYVKP